MQWSWFSFIINNYIVINNNKSQLVCHRTGPDFRSWILTFRSSSIVGSLGSTTLASSIQQAVCIVSLNLFKQERKIQ